MEQIEVKNGLYRHHKGTLYTVIGTAVHTETGEQLVLYTETMGGADKGEIWARPVSMFIDDVPRFKFLG